MIIESDFHDYYDPIVRTAGVDKRVVYIRKTTEIKEDPWAKALPGLYERWDSNKRLDQHLVKVFVIAGKVYPLLDASAWVNSHHEEKIFYGMDEVRKFYAKALTYEKRYRFLSDWSSTAKLQKLEQLCARDHVEECIRLRCPVFMVELEKHVLTLNPNLRSFGLQHVVPPVTTYQDIYTFLSGVLSNPEKEPQPISDKAKTQLYGFDKRTSFRKDTPPTRKQKA
jgi:hypothetical protein